MNEPILACKTLHKVFHDGKIHVEVLRDINFAIRPNETITIVGSSGAGKSTLLHCLGGLDKPTSGEVYLANKPFGKLSESKKAYLRNQYLGFIYQFHHLLLEFSALENVCMPLLIRNESPHQAKDKAFKLLTDVGLANRVEHRIGELSGGERQRVAIARALVNHPKCVLADEPTGNLDRKTADKVLDTMLQLQAMYQTAFVIVTHDEEIAARTGNICHMVDGMLN